MKLSRKLYAFGLSSHPVGGRSQYYKVYILYYVSKSEKKKKKTIAHVENREKKNVRPDFSA